MTKLLNRQFRAFSLYALVVLVCSIPAYFIIVDQIWLSELDEHNKIIALQAQTGLDSLQINEAEIPQLLELWNKTRPGSSLVLATPEQIRPDSSYEIEREVIFETGAETDRFRGLVTYVHLNKKPYRLTVETNVEEVDETALAIAAITSVFFLLLVGGFVLFNRKLTRLLWSPFNDTLEKLRTFDIASREMLTLNSGGIAEFEELNQALMRLAERNTKLFRQQKEFTENASHELQTPLAIIQSRLDLMLQTHGLTREQAELIEQVHITLSRISLLNKNLLLLARIDNNQFSELQPVNLSVLCEENTGLLREIIREKGLDFETSIANDIVLTANKPLVEILFNNLLSNAIRHNIPSEKIHIILSRTQLTICNAGTQSLDTGALFKRFSGVAVSNLGSGLGLAISKQICERYGWAISYSFQEGQHRFSVIF